MTFRLVLCCLVLVCGCNGVLVPPVVKPVNPDARHPVVDTVNPATAATRQLATDRADSWNRIVAKVRSREIKTVAELAAESLKDDEAASGRFNATLVAYIKQLLNSADGDLPANAADVLSALPHGFQEALK